jgi:homospermidine synthase
MILLGLGGVGRALLELLPICRLIPVGRSLTVVEPREIGHLPELRAYKWHHVKARLTRANLEAILEPVFLAAAAEASVDATARVFFDCSVNVDALAVMRLCHKFNFLYTNSSMEAWDTPDAGHIDPAPKALFGRSLCSRIWQARDLFGKRGPTMLADQGMNPGIVSLFALQGLEDSAAAAGNAEAVAAMRRGEYARAAAALGVRAIHITERDTQTLRKTRPTGQFWNTWSAVGLIAESLDPVQMGRGTHEDPAPLGALEVRNMRILPSRGMDIRAWSYSPSRKGAGGRFTGMLIPHGEANTLSTALTLPGPDGPTRPSVYFVYQPSPFARAALAEMRRGTARRAPYAPPPDADTRVVTLPEIRSGYDAVGALIWASRGKGRSEAWWAGTVLDRRDMAALGVRWAGPTTIQVAIALLAAMKWMLAHPSQGFITPEDLPYREVLQDCIPFLGRVESMPVRVPGGVPPSLRLGTFLLGGRSTVKKASATKRPRTAKKTAAAKRSTAAKKAVAAKKATAAKKAAAARKPAAGLAKKRPARRPGG